MVFGALFFNKLGSKVMTWFNLIGLVIVVFVLLATRVHYSIDIVAGVVISLEVYWLVNQLMPWLDWLWSIPYMLALKLKRLLELR
jgi:hypothetical protein